MKRFLIITLAYLALAVYIKGFNVVWTAMWSEHLWITLTYVIGIPIYVISKTYFQKDETIIDIND